MRNQREDKDKKRINEIIENLDKVEENMDKIEEEVVSDENETKKEKMTKSEKICVFLNMITLLILAISIGIVLLEKIK